MNLTKRYIAAEITANATLGMVHVGSELYRVTHTFKDGLTEKEIELIERKARELQAIQQLLVKVHHRLRQSGRCT